MRSEIKPATAVVIIVVVVAIAAAFLWKTTSSTHIDMKNTMGSAFQSLANDPKKAEMVRKRFIELRQQAGAATPAAPAGQTGQ